MAWQQAHGVGFQIMDTDWEFISNTFTIAGGRRARGRGRGCVIFQRSVSRLLPSISGCRLLAHSDDNAVVERAVVAQWPVSRHSCRPLHKRIRPH